MSTSTITPDSDSLSTPLQVPQSPDAMNAQPVAPQPTQPTSGSLNDTVSRLSGQQGANQPTPEQQGANAANDAAVRPRTGLFARILYGALNGIKGAGEGLAMGGVPGAIEGAVTPKTAQTAWDQRQQYAQSRVDFFQAQSALELTNALQAHNVMERQDEEWKQNQSDRAIDKMMAFQHLGLSASEFPDDNPQDAMRVANDFLSSGKIPYVLHAPASGGAHGQLIVYDLAPMLKAPTMPEAVKQGLALVNDPTTDKDFVGMNPQQRLAVIQKGLTGVDLNPAGSPSEILNQINQLTSFKRVYAASHANDPDLKGTLSKYDTSIQSLKDARNNLLSGATQEANIAAARAQQLANSKETGKRTADIANPLPQKPGAANANAQFFEGTDATGNQVAGTPDELQAAGVKNFVKMPALVQTQTLAARELTSPDGLFATARKQILDLQNRGELGPVASRWNNFWAAKGLNGDQQAFRGTLQLIATKLMQAHMGNRGGKDALEHFAGLVPENSTPDALMTTLNNEWGYVSSLAKRPKVKGGSNGQ